MKYNNFSDLPVWKRGFDILLKTYVVTKAFPADERFGLISDMRRAANSITHNIAEGFGREGTKDKNHFYKISRGSAHELISQALVSCALSYLSEKDKDHMVSEFKKIIEELNYIMKSLRDNNK